MIEKEPITVVISEKGWIRAMKGHMADYAGLQFKDGDKLKLAFHANTTDKLVIVTTGGKAYTLGADKLPGGRGHGEPLRIIVDMDNDQAVLTAFVHDPARKLLIASTVGNGFIVAESDMVANTRKGKQIMNVSLPVETRLCVPVTGDHVAIIGENRKMLIFPLEQLPEMSRGKGVRLQRYKDGGSVRYPLLRHGGRAHLGRQRRTHAQPQEGRTHRVDCRPRPGRPSGAQGLPALRQVQLTGPVSRSIPIRPKPGSLSAGRITSRPKTSPASLSSTP
jgi:DNA gyrase/topoisomerase IV subunit A